MTARLASALRDRYLIERELGTGGMATVYLAEDLKHERKVAVKVLRPELAAALGADRFLREIKISARLHHPHILALYDSGEAGGFLYYVMPYVEGETLRDRLGREKQLPLEDAVQIAREVADALSYAHSHGVVHRDVKPENILLESDHATVADFGIARAISAAGGDRLTGTGVAIGTPAYMSPEQAAGEGDVDGRSDLYSLGCVLYEMLAGQPPFTGPTVESIVHQHLVAEPQVVTVIRPGVSLEVAHTVRRALAKAAADRFATATQFAEALATPTSGATPPVAPTALRHPPPARVVALFGLASLAVLGIVYVLMVVLGLPGWVLPGAAILLAAGLPVMLLTGRAERRRAGGRGSAVDHHPLHRWLTWRNAVLGGVLAFAGLGVVVTAYSVMRVLGIGPIGTLMAAGVLAEREPLILADFANRTSDSTLGSTVTQLFRVGVTQSSVVNILEPTKVGAVLERMQRDPSAPVDLPLAMEIAEREGIKAVVAGEISSVGSGYAISARVVSPTGDVLTAQQESAANADGIIAAVGHLSGKIRERIGESLRTIRGTAPLEQVTTGSLQALRLYSQAVRAENAGDFARATQLLDQAVALDTAFAMAYRKLGVILGNTGEQPARRVAAMTKSYEHRDRLTEVERYRATGMYHLGVTQDHERAIGAYRTLLELVPDDQATLTNLSVLYWQLRDYSRSLEYAVRSLALDSSHAIGFWNVAETRFLLGHDDELTKILERFAAWHPDNPAVLGFRALAASALGDYEAADREIRQLGDVQRGSLLWMQNVHLFSAEVAAIRGKLRQADREWQDALAVTEQRELAGEYLVHASRRALADALVRGDPESAVRKVDAVLRRHPLQSVAPLDRPYQQLVTLYAAAGRLDRARTLLAQYKGVVSAQGSREAMLPYHAAAGAVAIAEGRADDAIEAFREADAGTCRICALPGLARAYDVAGQVDSAITVYERYVAARWLTRVEDTDFLFLPDAYRRLGELHEERGEQAKAVEYYNKFVELWNDADAELQPRVREARQRLRRLVGEGSEGSRQQ